MYSCKNETKTNVVTENISEIAFKSFFDQDILPDIVETHEATGVKSVDNNNLTWYLVNAVKELSAKNDTLAAEVEQLKSQLNN